MAKIPGRMERVPFRTPATGQQFMVRGYERIAQGRRDWARTMQQLSNQLWGLSEKLIGDMRQANLESQYNNAKTEATLAFQDWMSALPKMDITEEEIRQVEQPELPGMPPTGSGIGMATSRIPETITSNYKNYDKYLESYEDFQGQLYDRVSQGLKHPEAKVAFDEWWGAAMTSNRAKVIDFRISSEIEQLGADWLSRKDYYVDSRDKNGFVADTRRMVELGVLNPTKAEQAISGVTQEINRLMVEDHALSLGAEEGLIWLSETTEPMELYDVTSDEQLEIYRKLNSANTARENRINKETNERMRQGMWEAEVAIRDGQYFTTDDLDKSKWNYTPEAKSSILSFQDKWINAEQRDQEAERDKVKMGYLADMGVKLVDGKMTNEDLNQIRDRYPEEYPEFLGAYQKLASPDTDPQKAEAIRWEAHMSALFRDGNAPALKQMLDATYTHENLEIVKLADEWSSSYRSLLDDLVADRNRLATAKSAFDVTDPGMYFQYIGMLWDPNVKGDYIKDWLGPRHGPDANGNPQFSSDDYDRAMGEIDKIKEGQIFKTTAARQGAQDIIDITGGWMKEAETTEEQLRIKDLTRDIMDAYQERHEEYDDPTEFAKKLLAPPLEKRAGEKLLNFGRRIGSFIGVGDYSEIPSWDFEQVDWESEEWPERKPPGMYVEAPVGTPSGMIEALTRARELAYLDDNGDAYIEFSKDGSKAKIWGKDGQWHTLDPALARSIIGK